MKSLKLFLLAFAATITIGAVAQDSVIPSRLRVQSIGVGIQAPTTNGDARANRIGVGTAPAGAAGTVTATTITGAHTGNGSGLTNLDAGNIATGTLAVARGGTGVTSSTGTGSVVLSASPTLTGTTTAATIAATAVTVGGNNVCQSTGTNCPAAGPRFAYAVIIANAGGCSVNSTWQHAGFTTCTRNSIGNYSITFSPTWSNEPVCVGNQIAPTTGFGAVNTTSTSSANFHEVNTSFANADNGMFHIMCVGVP